MVSTSFQKIEKEEISNLRFPQTEVLIEPTAIVERRSSLDKALSLGNLEHNKIKIFFEDDTSDKMVETTVWGVTDKRVILKQGIVIPINRIKAVEL
jgi:Flp pilus assembly CpaE family ATPase